MSHAHSKTSAGSGLPGSAGRDRAQPPGPVASPAGTAAHEGAVPAGRNVDVAGADPYLGEEYEDAWGNFREPELVDEHEGRWSKYDRAMAEARARLDDELANASLRLAAVTASAYLEYDRAVDAALSNMTGARARACMAHAAAGAPS